jgi:hypothetical protein
VREQRCLNAVAVEQPQENVLQTQRTIVTQHVCFAIKFGATVDERCDADKVKIAAEIVVIQNRATLANSTD